MKNMENFRKKHQQDYGFDDALNYIDRQMSNYQRERGSSRGGSGRGDGSNRSSSESDPELKQLAYIYEMIEDLFEEKGLDPRNFLESQRRGR